MKHRLRMTALLLEYAFRAIILVWQEHTEVTWERQHKMISLTVYNTNHGLEGE